MGWLLPAVLIIPIFFGASFGPIVGLLVGVLGGMFSNLIFQGADALHLPLFHSYRFVYSWWIPYLIYAVAGLAPGLAVVFRKKLYPSVGSTIRSCLLTIIGLGATIAFILYQSNGKFNEMRLYPYIGLSVLLTVGISFVILLVYSVAARLIDPA